MNTKESDQQLQQHQKDPQQEKRLEQTQQHKETEQEQEQQQQQQEEQEQEKHPISRSRPIIMFPSPPLTPLSPPFWPPPSQPPLDSPPDHSTRFSDYSSETPSHVVSSPSHEARLPSPSRTLQQPATTEVRKAGSKAIGDGLDVRHVEESGGVGAGSTGIRRLRPNLSTLRKANTENIKRRVLLGSRIFAFLCCLISFSVMAADKNQGWALDSFHRYKEFRYCLAVNVLGFVYSGLQAYDLGYSLTTGNYFARNQLRYVVDFAVDQILTYLLLSASSSAAFRVEDWVSNWGKDKFPTMATASVAFSFLSFVAFALSSLLSGYAFFTPKFS